METPTLTRMLALVESRDMAVLATTDGREPHASLMAYTSADGGRIIYLATGTDSSKYRNLTAHPRVSLLIDTRETAACPGSESPRSAIQALTVGGSAELVPPDSAAEIDALFRERHPHMHDFLDDASTVFLVVHVTDLLLLDGVTDATFLRLADEDASPQA
jgi:general stress protein 26